MTQEVPAPGGPIRQSRAAGSGGARTAPRPDPRPEAEPGRPGIQPGTEPGSETGNGTLDPAPLDAVLRDFAAGQGAKLVALDFDGTLAPIVDDPTTSRSLAPAAAALRRIAALPAAAGTALALVSGRALADLAERADPPPGTILIGSHGAEVGHAREAGVWADPIGLTPAQRTTLTQLVAAFRDIVVNRPGAWVQTKPTAAVVHTRLADPDDARAVTEQATAVANHLGLDAMHGKAVVEVAVLRTSKGEAIRRLRAGLGEAAANAARPGDSAGEPANPAEPAVRVLYAGDDTTDETVFAVLGPDDVGIKVGAGATGARHRIPGPGELADCLGRLADLLAAGPAAPRHSG